ncbi:MAG TPA: MATE family efflux transporter [Cryomorphaceae bacterium]|nr:MATE family efflux transporter [Cryomorphaceae bacterium]
MVYRWSTYSQQYKISLTLAYPVVIGQLGQIMVSVADSIMVGKFLGTIPLAAISLAVSVLIIPMVFAIGVAYGLTPLVAGADGEENPAAATKYFKNGLVLNSILGLLIYGFIALFAEGAYLLGQDERVVSQALPYIHVVGFSIVPMMSFFAFKQFAEGLSDTKAAMRVSLAANFLNVLLNYPLITGWGPFPELGLMGAAVSTLVTRFLMLGGMAIYIRKQGKFALYWSFWRSSAADWPTIKEILNIGVPSGLQYVFEAGAFAMSGVIVGMIGPVQQAAHQIALNIASVSYMMVSGLGAAATIRMGNQLGRKDYPMLRLAGQSLFHLTFFFMLVTMTLLILLQNFLPQFYSSDPEVLQYSAALMVAAGIFQMPDGMQATALGALRGIKDMSIPTIVAFIAYWVIAVPLCYFLGVHLEKGPIGVWMGLTVGLVLASIALYWRFRHKTLRMH